MFSAVLTAFLGLNVAHAKGFEPHTSLEPISNRSIDRRLVLGMGWFQVELGSDYKDAIGYWNRNYSEIQTADGEVLNYTPFSTSSCLLNCTS